MNKNQSYVALHDAFDGAVEGIFLKDQNGRYLYINSAGAQILGRKPAQIVGQDDTALYSPDISERLRKLEQSIFRFRHPAVFQLARRVSGLRRNFVFTLQPYQTPDNGPAGILGMIRPLSDNREGLLPPPLYNLAAAPPLPPGSARPAPVRQRRAGDAVLQLNRALLSVQSAAAAIASSLNLQHVLDTFSWELVNMLDAHHSAVYSWYPEDNKIVQIANFGAPGLDGNNAGINLAKRPIARTILHGRQTRQFQISSPDTDALEAAYMSSHGLASLLLLPMVFQDRVLGLVEIGFEEENHLFTEQAISLAQLLTNQASAAVSNARLYEELGQKLQELSSLNQISQAVTATLDLSKTLTLITSHTVDLLNVAAASVALADEDKKEVWYAASSGAAADYIRGKRLKMGLGIVGQVIELGESRLVADVTKDPHHHSEFDAESGFQTRSILCVPLRVHNQTVGAIQALNPTIGDFSQEHMRLLKSLAVPAATAIYNARLYQQARQEVIERTRAEERIQSSLEEKEVLLKEIHHRVKNNLQVISSLINLQSEFVEDPHTLGVFQDSQDRIRSMALIHEKLYRSQNLAYIDLAEYVLDLSGYLAQSHSASGRGILVQVEVENVYLDVNTAVPCGLLLNELISNAFKHAFHGFSSGQITVRAQLVSEDELQVQVQDNGNGFPEDLDFRQTNSLGLQLVSSLVTQLDGNIALERKPGTTFTILFPVKD